MKNISIRTLLVCSFAVIVGFLLAISALSMLSSAAEHEAALRQEERYAAYLLADELRQSSDDLTRLARTYVVSGGAPEYERQYNEILDIRDGRKPRPQDYHRIYWDFVAAGQPQPRPSTTAVPLLTLMKQAGFSAEELAKLEQSAANSNELVQTEVRAMNAVKGLYPDERGNYTVARAPDLELARALLHSRDYHLYKAKVVAPVDEFFVLLEQRTATQVAQSVAHSQALKTLLMAITALAVVVSLVLGWLLFAKIVPPVRRLVDAAQNMARGQFDFTLALGSHDEVGTLTQSLGAMQSAVQRMVADASLLSKAAVEGKLATRADASKHQGDYRQIVQGVNDTLDAVIGPLNVAAKYVDDIAKGSIPPKITDSYNGDFNTIKNNLNTCIDALNGLIADMGHMSKEHNAGDIDVRIDDARFQGAYQTMARGVNEMVFGHIAVKKLAMGVIRSFGEGNMDAPLDPLPGKKRFINDTIEQVRANINALVADASLLSQAAVQGKLATRADAGQHQGDFRKIVQGVNDTLDAVIGPLNVAAKYVELIALGDIPKPITDTYHGDFNTIKNNLNACIEATNQQSAAAQAI
uniref:HAMP domain-containing protein n=1 Tax=Macromonas bipunctata TaxID=183670 RepID=UPI0011AED06F